VIRHGPPGEDGESRARNNPALTQQSDDTTATRHNSITQTRQRGGHGRYAQAWRCGFGAGFADALRLAARRIDDPHVWATLSTLADEFELAGCDD
jgi:hypothetical protein